MTQHIACDRQKEVGNESVGVSFPLNEIRTFLRCTDCVLSLPALCSSATGGMGAPVFSEVSVLADEDITSQQKREKLQVTVAKAPYNSIGAAESPT